MIMVLWFFMSSFDGSSRQIDLVSLLHSHYEFEEEEEETVGVSRDTSVTSVTRQFETGHVTGSQLLPAPLSRREDSETPKIPPPSRDEGNEVANDEVLEERLRRLIRCPIVRALPGGVLAPLNEAAHVWGAPD